MSQTVHFDLRNERIQFIKNEIGSGQVLDKFLWDRHHPSGPEIHYITSTGLIFIKNAITDKWITVLIARPGQIRRYYEMANLPIPKGLIEIAEKHQKLGYNVK